MDVFEPFTQPLKYNIQIEHPRKGWGTVTVGNVASTSGRTEIGKLRHMETLVATLSFVGDEIWGTVVEFPRDPSYVDGHFALRYGGKNFGSYKPVPSETEGGLIKYRVKDDWNSPIRWQFKLRYMPVFSKGVPAVNPVAPVNKGTGLPDYPATSRCDMTEEIQWYWMDLFALSKFGKKYKALTREQRAFLIGPFKDTTASNKFMTDGSGTDTGRNYITRERLWKGYAKQESKIIAGQFVYSFSHWSQIVNSQGITMVRLHSFLANEPLPEPDLNDPRVIIAKTVRRDKTYGDFAHLKGAPLPYPFITKEPVYCPLAELVAV